eukprot:400641_1
MQAGIKIQVNPPTPEQQLEQQQLEQQQQQSQQSQQEENVNGVSSSMPLLLQPIQEDAAQAPRASFKTITTLPHLIGRASIGYSPHTNYKINAGKWRKKKKKHKKQQDDDDDDDYGFGDDDDDDDDDD